MKIDRIQVYQVDLPLEEGPYRWSEGKSVAVFDSTVVAISTDEGLVGWGEVCPLGPAYLPAYAEGARTGIHSLAGHLIGEDPLQLEKLNRLMDHRIKGHGYVKSALDMACWDILGQATGLPVCDLLGGRYGESFPLYRAISQDTPERMAQSVGHYKSQGYCRFQLKVGGDPDEDVARIEAVDRMRSAEDRVIADANTGWRMHDALRVVRAVRRLDVYIEQPCPSYEECLAVRRRTDHPFILDEVIDGVDKIVRGYSDQAMDAVNIKISKFGGMTRARQARDLCVALGVTVTIEDSWGGDIITAAISHLAHSTPTDFLFTTTDFNSYVTVSIADGAPRRQRGRLSAPSQPGLGIQPRTDVIGPPVITVTDKS